ncbi:ABC transporter ATP-binding protein [Spirillospora sp. CA-294931]|uniref:ABC transporter ATP-binding protein n=1 Tax=Spirillospora sp. CA-294931 TaxID=3240042 RepID=UPI003D8DE3EB
MSKVYPGGVRAVNDLDLEIRDGELLVLLGPSGCGKSTVLRMIAGLEEITSGDLHLGDRHANDLVPRDRNVAMVFQSGALYPHLDIQGNLSFPLQLAGERAEDIREKVIELSRALRIDETLGRRPGTLSGGQRQRVAMGRAIIREPSVFLMDEPLSNLDAALRTDLRLEIGSLIRGLGVTTVYVTHDQVEALTLADRIAVMRGGRLEDLGTPSQVYDDPGTAFVAAFLGAPQINLIAGTPYSRDNGVIVGLGGHELFVPWTDPRAEFLARRHGEPVIVGVRADGLMPRSEPSTISGTVRALEYHGHEWLAYVESGVPMVDLEERPETVVAQEQPVQGRLRSLLRRRPPAPPPTDHVGSHRRTDLVVRLHSGTGWRKGLVMHMEIDLPRVLFFDSTGRRVDPVAR